MEVLLWLIERNIYQTEYEISKPELLELELSAS
jgi:hypothetical protein